MKPASFCPRFPTGRTSVSPYGEGICPYDSLGATGPGDRFEPLGSTSDPRYSAGARGYFPRLAGHPPSGNAGAGQAVLRRRWVASRLWWWRPKSLATRLTSTRRARWEPPSFAAPNPPPNTPWAGKELPLPRLVSPGDVRHRVRIFASRRARFPALAFALGVKSGFTKTVLPVRDTQQETSRYGRNCRSGVCQSMPKRRVPLSWLVRFSHHGGPFGATESDNLARLNSDTLHTLLCFFILIRKLYCFQLVLSFGRRKIAFFTLYFQ